MEAASGQTSLQFSKNGADSNLCRLTSPFVFAPVFFSFCLSDKHPQVTDFTLALDQTC